MKVYEGMFLMDPALSSDWAAAEGEVQRLLGRAEAKVLGVKNWDERRLAYPIRKHKRGLYILTYFQAPPEKITGLERDVELSEKCLRALILNRDGITTEVIEKTLAAEPPKAVSRYDERPGGRPDRGDRGPRSDSRGGDMGADVDDIPDVMESVIDSAD